MTTLVFLLRTSGAVNWPSDWNSSSNQIDGIGAGGGGTNGTAGNAAGGGARAQLVNYADRRHGDYLFDFGRRAGATSAVNGGPGRIQLLGHHLT